MDLTALRCFVRTAELRSISAAAVSLDLTQSGISKRIASLEQEVGARLFERTGRGMMLSTLGQELLPKALDLLARADELSTYGRQRSRIPKGEVRIGLLPSLSFVAIELYKLVREKFPAVSLIISESFSSGLEHELAYGTLDLATINRFTRRECEGLELVGIADTYLVGRKGQPGVDGPAVEFRELSRVPLIIPPLPDKFRQMVEAVAKKEEVKLNVVLQILSTHLMVQAVCHTDGYSLLTLQSVQDPIRQNLVSASKVINPLLRRHVILASSTSRPATIAVREVAMLLRQVLQRALDPPDE